MSDYKIHALLVGLPEDNFSVQFLERCREDRLCGERLGWEVVSPQEVTPEVLRKPQVLVCTRFPAEWVRLAENLKWVQFTGAGIEHALTPELVGSDIVLTNASGVHKAAIPEHIMGMMLMFARGLQMCIRFQMSHDWDTRDRFDNLVTELEGATLGIVGLGAIGEGLAVRAKAFGMRVIAIKRDPSHGEGIADELMPPERLQDLLTQSDYVAVCAPLTAETRGMFGEAEFRQMKKNAIFINIARGAIVQQEVMIRALREGWIRGAGLDVTDPEPLPADSLLWDMENVIISPHVAGLTPIYGRRTAEIFLESLPAFLRGDYAAMCNLVDKKHGY